MGKIESSPWISFCESGNEFELQHSESRSLLKVDAEWFLLVRIILLINSKIFERRLYLSIVLIFVYKFLFNTIFLN